MAKTGDRFDFQPPRLPPLLGAPWEQEERKAAGEVAYSLRAKADRERMAQERSHRELLRDLDLRIEDADKALTAAHQKSGDLAAMSHEGRERTGWVDFTNKVAHVRDEMRRMLKDFPS